MADEVVDVIYKGLLKRATATEVKKKSFLSRQSSTWKKRFFVLLRRYDDEEQEECPFLCMYEKEPTNEADPPKACLKLWPHYRVDKKHDEAGKVFIFEVRTPEDSLRLQSDSEANLDLWVFYLQIQTKLRQDFPGYCFEVTPEESDAMRRIGAKGSKCLLHVSKWGLTLALKRTRSLLAQWPLKSIRIFESTETGEFSFEAGRSAPMGEARYLFGTLQGEDGRMYDLLDGFTSEMQLERNDGTTDPNQPATEEEVVREYEKLRLATFGLLTHRASSVSSTGTPAASMAVPVPVPPSRGTTVGYDHLHRAQEGLARQQSERQPAVPSRTPGIQIRGNPGHPLPPSEASGPPLPPRQEGLKQHPSSFQRSYSERGHSLERYGRSMEAHDSPIYPEEEPYTTMTPSSVQSRGSRGHRSFTESDLQQFARAGESFGNFIAAEKFQRMLSNNPNASMSEYEAMALRLGQNPYQKSGMALSPNSYENTPLISPSPRDGIWPGFPNMGFVSSPQSVETGPPVLPRKYQPPTRPSGAIDVHTNSADHHQPIRHTYFQYQFTREPQSSGTKAGAGVRPPSYIPGFSSVKGSSLGSHQYQEVNLYDSPKRTLRRSMSVDDFFRIRSLSVSSSISSAPSVRSTLVGSLDLATNYAKTTGVPIWMKSRQLPSPPSPGAHTPEFNTYCGSPKSAFPHFTDFGAAPAAYDEIKRNRDSFNNNNHGQAVNSSRDEHSQAKEEDLKDNRDVSQEEGYLEPIFKMRRSRSAGDILDVIQSEAASNTATRDKKSHPRARSKSKGFFATLRKRTDSNPDLLATAQPSGNSSAKQGPQRSAIATLIRRAQSNSDLLGDKPVSPSQQYKPACSPNVAAVKPASHTASAAPVQRKKKFDFPLKIFRQSSKSSDREEGRSNSGGSEDENKSERRGSKSSLSDTKSSPKMQIQSDENNTKLPKVKGIVASEKMISFVKVRPPGVQGQSPSPKATPAVTAKPRVTSPSNASSPRMQSLSPVEMLSASPFEKAALDRLKEVTNRPLPSPPQNSSPVLTDLPNMPNVKQFIPGMNRHSSVNEYNKGAPNLKPNRIKKTPPPPPPRDPNISLDSVSLKSSGSNASDHKGVVVARRRSSDVDQSPLSSDVESRSSVGSVSLRSSRPNSNGSQYENTAFGSLPASSRTPPGSLSGRFSDTSFDGGIVGRSSFSESHRRVSGGSGSLRSSRTNSNGSQYENTAFRSLPNEMGTPPASLSGRLSGMSWDGTTVGKSSSFSEGDRVRLSMSNSPHGSLHRNSNGSQYENSDCGSLPSGESSTRPGPESDSGSLWL